MNRTMIPIAALPNVLSLMGDTEPLWSAEGQTAVYTYGRGKAKLYMSVKCPDRDTPRITRVMLTLDTDEASKHLAQSLGLALPAERTSFEFCCDEGERLDVQAPSIKRLEKQVWKQTIGDFLPQLQAAA